MGTAFVFPGQGSQQVGMGKALAENFPVARAVFEEVDEALGQKLSAIMWDGPDDQLTLTANTQPALLAVSIAVLRVLEAEHGLDLARHAKFVAGHSLGEYSALAAARSIALSDAARLLRIRGDAMQEAVPVGQGGMAALIGTDPDQAREIAAEAAQGDVLAVANDNGGGQVVVSGHKAAAERAIEIAKAKGVKRGILLPVSAPFHSPLMAPAAERMRWRCRYRGQCSGRARRRQYGRARRHRSRRNPPAAGRAGDRDGALARERGLYGRGTA